MEVFDSLLYMLAQMAPYVLLGFFIAGLMHAFVPRTLMARHLSGSGFKSVFKSALIGVPLPLCSCGVLPTAIAMRRGGASRAATTSFLIATPQTGVDSIAATYSLLGPFFAVIRPIAAFVTAIFGGVAVGRTERDETKRAGACDVAGDETDDRPHGFVNRMVDALRYGFFDLVSSIGGWLVIGLVIAALITVYVPAEYFSILADNPILAMIAVVIVAVPMYVCATGSIPIAMSLMMKGLSPGTALVLLMAGPAANFASYTLISREMGRRAAFVYLGSIVVGSIAFGLAIDYLMPREWFTVDCMHGHAHADGFGMIDTVSAVVLGALLLIAFVRRFIKTSTIKQTDMAKQYNVRGMSCAHCQATVTKSIAAVKGVTAVDVNLSTGVATVEGEHDAGKVRAAVRAAGYDID